MSCSLLSDCSPSPGFAVLFKSELNKCYSIKYLEKEDKYGSTVKIIHFRNCVRMKDISKIVNVVINMLGLSITSGNISVDILKLKILGSQTVRKLPFNDGSFIVIKEVTLPPDSNINYNGYDLVAEVRGVINPVHVSGNVFIMLSQFYNPIITYRSVINALIKMRNMHNSGIFHGDCHSGNIMMDKIGNLKLVDPVCLLNNNPIYRNVAYFGKNQYHVDYSMFINSCLEIYMVSNNIKNKDHVCVFNDELIVDTKSYHPKFVDLTKFDDVQNIFEKFKQRDTIEAETDEDSNLSDNDNYDVDDDFKSY
jgi:hypothetical protein